jgi:hypothetical protein
MNTTRMLERISELESKHESEITDDEQDELNQIANEIEATRLTVSLGDLLRLNAGYNPENASDLGEYELLNNGTLLLINGRAYIKTDAKSLGEFILNYGGRFGVVLASRYFVEEV